VVNLGLAPTIPFTTQPDPAILANLETLTNGSLLAQGVQLYAEQCVACHGADGLGSGLAPALNDPAVRSRSIEEIERIIRLGVPGTLMAGWEKSLGDDQITAALELITRWEEVPLGAIPAPDRPVPTTLESLALGSEIFTANCARCHGPEGQGSQRAPSLNVSGFLSSTTDLAIQQIVSLGVPGTAMPAWGDRLTDAEILALVGFIRSWEPTAPEVAEPARVQGGPWWRSSGTAAGSTTGTGGQTGQGNATQATGVGQQAGQGNAAQTTSAATGWQIPDWRILLFVGLPTLAALGMILFAIRGLRRLAM
jgi:mono/diheme cytochrome c family protein